MANPWIAEFANRVRNREQRITALEAEVERLQAEPPLLLTWANYEASVERIAALEAEVERRVEKASELTAKVDRLMRHLESLTPGGSEFHGSPARCVEWVRDRLSGVINQVKRRQAAEAEVEQLRTALKAEVRKCLVAECAALEPKEVRDG